jgi:alpha-galactosidase
MLASFSLSGLTPFDLADAPERLAAHRIRSAWSSEGRIESRLLEELQLERSWTGHAPMSERFGQVGSQPVRGFFPFVALEDTAAGVCWGVQLEIASSWQLEVYRRHDDACISGGIADREFGHWWKTVEPGGSFTTPKAAVAVVSGDIEDLCHSLTSLQERAALLQPSIENELPMVFNEWCSSWGKPTRDNLLATADRLAGTRTRYLVIDDGWAEKIGEGIQQNGDWNVNLTAFPGGLAAICADIRSKGFIPGLWFEFEVCTEGTKAWLKTDHHLHRDGEVLRVGTRRFWDFRDPWTFEYLGEKVIRLLKDNGFGYMKVDYNETVGIGVDGTESPGENLRLHVLGVQEFFREVRRQIPDIIIENCSSGGHRLEPSMMAVCGMGSFSDAHETTDIPIIAANLQRVILPRQSQVWAVLRKGDSRQRLCYSLAATFLGRMAISGDLAELSQEQFAVLRLAQDFYHSVVPVIRNGKSRRFGSSGPSYRHPRGWQAVRRESGDGRKILLVVHSFADAPEDTLSVPLPAGRWKLAAGFNPPAGIELSPGMVSLGSLPDFTGCALVLER